MENFCFKIAPRPSKSDIMASNKLFSSSVHFVKGVVDDAGFPENERNEICFAGRSNVGKSSLLNALVERKNLARTSSTPGRTQEINFFALGERLYIVDLPGYGYAKAPVKRVVRWQELLKRYLQGRANLRRVFMLIDARHGFKSADLEMLSLLNKAAVSFQVVVTKADKLKPSEIDNIVLKYTQKLISFPAAYSEIIITSALKHIGLDILKVVIHELEEV